MELSTHDINFLVEFLRRNEYNATQSHAMITKAFGEGAVGLRRVQIIAKEFADGERIDFDRKSGSGSAISERRAELGNSIKLELSENAHASIRYFAAKDQVSFHMVRDIITKDLEFKSIACRWVPYTLTDVHKEKRVEDCHAILNCLSQRITKKNLIIIDEKQFFDRPLGCPTTRRSWVEPGGDVPQLARRSPMEKKFMAMVAITFTGLCHVKVLERRETVDSHVYIQFLRDLLAAFNTYDLRMSHKAINPENAIIMHDNARPHVSNATTTFLNRENIHTLHQPAYSPDVNMLDRMFFPKCEMKRKDITFSSREEVENFVRESASTNTVDIMDYEYEKLVDHCEQIIQCDGEYVT
jgi:hypothetical protein